MAFDRFLIAPYNSGWQNNLRPWLIPDDAFEQLINAYVFRGRVRKRFGSTYMQGSSLGSVAQLISRLRIQVGITDGSGDLSGTVPGTIFALGQLFSIGSEIFTVNATGTPANLLKTGTTVTATFNTTTGAYVFAGAAANTAVYFYPALPVMGITTYNAAGTTINNQPPYAFDTQFAYTYSGSGWYRSGTGTTPIWHGNELNFFWSANWYGFNNAGTAYITALFVSNFQVTNPNGAPVATDDPIWYFDGTNWTAYYAYFAPAGGAVGSGPFVQTARLIVPFKDRLLLLNTIETNSAGTANTNYVNRCRYSWNGSPFADNAWYEPGQQDASGNVGAGAGYIDATTDEQIVSAEFIKDRLIVFFERSTWELAYTGNEIQPFIWQKINTELGAESPMSSVPFDKYILTIGGTGVHSCNGANVERIDNQIPDQIFEIKNSNSATLRVAGIRDYKAEMVYWAYTSINDTPLSDFPNRILVYNYKNNTWSENDDCITAFGYWEQQIDLTWNDTTTTWEESNFTWTDGIIEAQSRRILAGNQQGYMFLLSADESRNAPVMQISDMSYDASTDQLFILCINHTLQSNNQDGLGDYVLIENCQGVTFSGPEFGLTSIYPVYSTPTANIFVIANVTQFTGTYTGGGTVSRVSNIGILSKQWNPYDKTDRNVYLAKIDFGVQKTQAGQVTVDYYPSSSDLSLIEQGGPLGTNSLTGNNVLETFAYPTVPLEDVQTRLWHPVYFNGEGECIQIFISMSEDQIIQKNIALADFELEGMILYTQATSYRMQ